MYFFSADWHLGHSNIIKYCNRPFMTSEEEGLLKMANNGAIPQKEVQISRESTTRMTDAIIDSTNAVVGANDTLVIDGDFCWTPKSDRLNTIKRYRERINCKNVFLILGNHDDRYLFNQSSMFAGVFEQYMFVVNGQNIFVSHYPCRSWDKAVHGSWMLYGHVHNNLWENDNGFLSKYQKRIYSKGFFDVLNKLSISEEEKNKALAELLDVSASIYGIDYTNDVGVDNVRENIPFGTPWSMDDLEDHFAKRRGRWLARHEQLGFRK